MLFDKGSMNIDWILKIKKQDANGVDEAGPNTRMNEIQSYIQPKNKGAIYACGYASQTVIRKVPVDGKEQEQEFEVYQSAMFKMSASKGELDYLYTWGQANVYSGVEDVTHRDKCKVITYDYENREIVMMMETTNADLRPNLSQYKGSIVYTDLVIITMSESGVFQNGYNINYE